MLAGTDTAHPLHYAVRKRGKSPGTQVQHTLETGTKGTGFRHFLASDCGTVWTITKTARTFAPVTRMLHNPLKRMGLSVESAIAAICFENRDLRNEAAIYTAVKQVSLR